MFRGLRSLRSARSELVRSKKLKSSCTMIRSTRTLCPSSVPRSRRATMTSTPGVVCIPKEKLTQWAAVRTHCGSIKVAPQNCAKKPSSSWELTRATIQGKLPGETGSPPMIRGSCSPGGVRASRSSSAVGRLILLDQAARVSKRADCKIQRDLIIFFRLTFCPLNPRHSPSVAVTVEPRFVNREWPHHVSHFFGSPLITIQPIAIGIPGSESILDSEI